MDVQLEKQNHRSILLQTQMANKFMRKKSALLLAIGEFKLNP